MLVMVKAAERLLVSVTTLAALEVAIAWPPKASAVGETVAGFTPVPDSATV